MIKGLDASFWICLHWVRVLFLGFCSSLDFVECDDCVFLVFLAYSTGVFPGKGMLVLEPVILGKLGEGRLEKNL